MHCNDSVSRGENPKKYICRSYVPGQWSFGVLVVLVRVDSFTIKHLCVIVSIFVVNSLMNHLHCKTDTSVSSLGSFQFF